MNTRRILKIAAAWLLLSTLRLPTATAFAQGTAFTYQGQLQNSSGPVSGTYNLTFTLYTNNLGGLVFAGPVTNSGVAITNGLFTVVVDFGAGVFTGSSNWLEVAVETNGGAAFATLRPRQQMTPAPYAIYAETSGSANTVVGGGGSGWGLTGNAGTTPGANFLGTTDNEALELKVNGATALLLQPASGNVVNVAVGPFSGIGTGLSGVTIAGGGYLGGPNLAYENWTTISGGFDQQILSGSSGAVIAGGQSQRILTGSGQAAIGGGYANVVGPGATGGTIPGGWNNLVSGTYGFAAGNTAQATNSGAFVWADNSGGAFASTANNQFSARAMGGVRFVTGGAGMTIDGQPVLTGSGSGWGLTGNAGTTPGTDFIGTTDNAALEFKVNGATALLLQPASGNVVNVAVGAFSGIGTGLSGVTIAGGGYLGGPNLAYENWTTISGGFDQQILSGSSGAVIAGGQSQRILTGSGQAAIGGGYANVVGPGATGGTIPGGWNNLVSGTYGFAAGNTAQATNSGAFVWADNSGGAFASTANNQFSARAMGGVRFVTGGAGMTIDGQPVLTGSGSGWGLTGNAGTSYSTDFMGTSDNQPLELRVNNVVAETLWPISGGTPSVALGPNSFFYLYGAGGSFVGPGGSYGLGANVTYGDFCVIGGGTGNKINATGADYSVISGGYGNYELSEFAVIGGGSNNTNTGTYATIPGGANNSVSGDYGFAAGENAAAANTGSFVWSDASGTRTTSTANNSVTFRASGGYTFYTGTGSGGAQLLAGASSWTTISDRNAKKNFHPVDGVGVLNKLAAIPIEQWNYKWENDGDVPNIGPMAQDFKQAFYPGRDDKGISTLEFDGVELAAIQGLNQKLEQKQAEITDLEARLEKLEQMMMEKNGGVK